MKNPKPRKPLLPVCWLRGHRPEGESIVETQIPGITYIKRCGRCGRYIFHSHIGEMTLTEKMALDLKRRHDRAMDFQPPEMEAQDV